MTLQWKTYRQLELITDSVLEPQPINSFVVTQVSLIWQLWANRLTQKMPFEQQLQHLEHCLKLDGTRADIAKKSSLWQTIWTFLNQPIFEGSWITNEPKVQQVSDQGGQVWWYVYDPTTRQSVYLESETEVLIWLEEHFSR